MQRHKGYEEQVWIRPKEDKNENSTSLFAVTPALPCLHIVKYPRKALPAMTANGSCLYGACGAMAMTAWVFQQE